MALCNPVEPSTLSMRVSSHDPKANTIARVARPKASESRDAVRRSQKAADLSSSLVRRLLTLNCVYAVSVLVSTLYLAFSGLTAGPGLGAVRSVGIPYRNHVHVHVCCPWANHRTR